MNFAWACPKCGAKPNEHGKGGAEGCREQHRRDCMGFICECEGDSEDGHGESLADVCKNANCYHCGWGGRFPRAPRGLLTWEKTALANGWKPPAARAAELKQKGARRAS